MFSAQNPYDLWARDLYYLQHAELALATHPTVAFVYPSAPPICRLLLASGVGAIEGVLDDNLDRDFLRPYADLLGSRRSVPNREKAEVLFQCLSSSRVVVALDVLLDFHCVKILRNLMIHTLEPKESEAALLSERDWPLEPDGFTTEHAQRIAHVLQTFWEYLAHAVFDRHGLDDERLILMSDLPITTGLASYRQRAAALTRPSREMEAWWASVQHAHRLARTAGLEDEGVRSELVSVAVEVSDRLNEVLAARGLDVAGAASSRQVLEALLQCGQFPVGSLSWSASDVLSPRVESTLEEVGYPRSVAALRELRARTTEMDPAELRQPSWTVSSGIVGPLLVRVLFDLDAEDRVDSIWRALRAGNTASELIRDRSLLELLLRLLPVAGGERDLAALARSALELVRLRSAFDVLSNDWRTPPGRDDGDSVRQGLAEMMERWASVEELIESAGSLRR